MNRPIGIFLLVLLLIGSVGVNAFFALPVFNTPQEEEVAPPLQPNEPPPVPDQVNPDPPPQPEPLPLVPVEPMEPREAEKPYEAALKITNKVGDRTYFGSGLMIKRGNLLLAITSKVFFLGGFGEVTVIDTRGRRFAANVVAVDEDRFVVALNVANYDHVYTVMKDASFQMGDKHFWAFGCEDNEFSGAAVFVRHHPTPSPSWTVFDAEPERVPGSWFGGPIFDTAGDLTGLLLGRAGGNCNQAIGINTTSIRQWLARFK